MTLLQELAEQWAHSPSDTTCDGCPRLWIGRTGGGLFIDFFGAPFDATFRDLLRALSAPETAENLAGVSLRGPDAGTNGTCAWDLEPWADVVASLPRLRSLAIEQGQSGQHHTHIVASSYEENGVLGRLLDKAPRLARLESPSAPSSNFFAVGRRPLHFLSVCAGYDHQDFIERLARSTCFPELGSVEYGEADGTGVTPVPRAPFEAYAALLRSSTVRPARLVLRNPSLSKEELASLAAMRPEMQLLVVWSRAAYCGPSPSPLPTEQRPENAEEAS